MGSGRSIAGNVSAIILAILGLLGYLPWLIASILIIAIAVIAMLPSSKKTGEDESSLTSTVSPSVVQHQEQHTDQKTSHSQNRPIQRLPQAIIEALRPVPATAAPKLEEKIPELDTGRPVQRIIPSGDYESLEYGIHEGEELSVDVQGDGPLNVYILTEDNLNSLDSDQEFWYEAGNEGTRNISLKFSPEESGTWFLVIENTGEKDVTAMLKVALGQPAHPVPLLRSEKLDLPEQRATGKLSI